MWHASVAGNIASKVRRRLAIQALQGVGDRTHEWESDRPMAYHVRRRLTAAETAIVGDVVDLRRTAEGAARLATATWLPEVLLDMAQEEVTST